MIFVLLLVLNFILLRNFNYISNNINIYDTPDNKLKLHKKKMPLLGGVIFFFNLFTVLFYQFLSKGNFLAFQFNFFNLTQKIAIILLILFFFLLGLIDDKLNLSPYKKIFYSIFFLSIGIFFNNNLIIDKISLSFYQNKIFFDNLSIFFTIFCVVILINALNFYDGINGQSCFFFLIIFIYLFLKSNFNQFYLICIFVLVFILYLNLSEHLFIGDSGIFILGSLTSVSFILEHNINNNIYYADEIFLLLILPGIDLLRLFITRLLKGNNPFYGDRSHIHHLLIKKFKLITSNVILLCLAVFPVILYFFLNFYFSLFIFITFYFSLVLFLSLNILKR